MANEKRLFLLDAFALIFRSYYAFIKNPMFNAVGLNTSCIFGFVNTLEELLLKEKPAYIAVAFDPGGQNFRHDMYPLYKANRDETPEDIKKSVPIIKDILKAGIMAPYAALAVGENEDFRRFFVFENGSKSMETASKLMSKKAEEQQ